jgi:hypothetical protein
MDEIRRADRALFLKETFSLGRILIYLVGFLIYGNLITLGPQIILLPFVVIVVTLISAYKASVQKRFRNVRLKQLWDGCQDRHRRFEEVMKTMRREKVAHLTELPETIRKVADSLYVALRRADVMSDEILRSEKEMAERPPIWQAGTNDAQSRELYRVADSNIAEYRRHYQGVIAGVQRTEAQSAVFMTTLDTLRIKALGYRMAGKSPELSSAAFLSALTEAKLQLGAIDQALEELEMGPFPKMIAAMPSGKEQAEIRQAPPIFRPQPPAPPAQDIHQQENQQP